MNIGHSSHSIYDSCYYPEYINQSTRPLQHKLDVNQIYSCDGCMSSLGPRGGRYGVSTPLKKTQYAESQYLTDVESVLSNRNVKLSKCKRSKTNPINVLNMKVYDKRLCGNTLNPESSLLSYPRQQYRGMGVNRFVDIPSNPQNNIYYDWAINSQLEAKDNWVPELPVPLSQDELMPKEKKTEVVKCGLTCSPLRK